MAPETAKLRTKVERLPIDSLRHLEVNARYMTADQQTRLTQNIERDGALTSDAGWGAPQHTTPRKAEVKMLTFLTSETIDYRIDPIEIPASLGISSLVGLPCRVDAIRKGGQVAGTAEITGPTSSRAIFLPGSLGVGEWSLQFLVTLPWGAVTEAHTVLVAIKQG